MPLNAPHGMFHNAPHGMPRNAPHGMFRNAPQAEHRKLHVEGAAGWWELWTSV